MPELTVFFASACANFIVCERMTSQLGEDGAGYVG
jgi:hypothetical protein